MKKVEIEFPKIEKTSLIEVGDDIEVGESILVDNGQVIESATVKNISAKQAKSENTDEAIKFFRKMTEEDKKKIESLHKVADSFISLCQEKIYRYNLDMKLLGAELSFDEKKLTFYFGSEGRVDFRDLVSDLAKTCRKIIRLQQIGPRDQTKVMGGYGKCGQQFCCNRFLPHFGSVTLDMAKDQAIMGSSSKISGACGKLMCCLAYELEEYKKVMSQMPEIGQMVKVKEGSGKVISLNALARSYCVQTDKGQRFEVEI